MQRRNGSQSHNSPAGLDDLLVLEAQTQIPRQMPDAVQRVEEEGECDGGLSGDLRNERPAGDGRDHGGSLKVPSEGGSGEVCEAEEVESTAQSDTGDTGEGREDPGDLGLVDGKMRGDGALLALLDENLLGLVSFDVLSGSASSVKTQVSTHCSAAIPCLLAGHTSVEPCAPPSGTSSCWGRPPVAGQAGRHASKT